MGETVERMVCLEKQGQLYTREEEREQLPSEPCPLDVLLGNSAEWGLLIQSAVTQEDFALSLRPPG